MIKIKISELLGKHKMTQKDLAIKANIRHGTVGAMYHETIQRIDLRHLDNICRILQCNVSDILVYEEGTP